MGENLIRNADYLGAIDQIGPNRLRPDGFKSDYTEGEQMGSPEDQYFSAIPEAKVFEAYNLSPEEREQFGLVDVEKAWMIFGNYVCWHGWFWQELTLEPGRYTLTVPAFIDVYSWDGGKVAPNLHLDSPKERAMRIRLRAGTSEGPWFDETLYPGADGWYLNHQELALTFDVTKAELHDVGIEVWAPWPLKNVGLVLGPWSLERVGDVEPEPGNCNPARPGYDRQAMYLLSQQAGIEGRIAAAIAGNRGKVTFGHSADHAMHGIDNTVVYAVNPDEWTTEDSDLWQFRDEWYPYAEIVDIEAGTPWELVTKTLPALEGDIALSQQDYAVDFGEHPGGGDIDTVGCFLTAATIMLRKVYGCDIHPPTLDRIFVNARAIYTSDNLMTGWADAVRLFPAFSEAKKDNAQRSAAELKALLDEGWEVILHQPSPQHFVYLESVEGETLHIIDTWDGKRKQKAASDYAGVRAAKVGSVDPKPQPGPEPQFPAPHQILGFQQQHTRDFRDEYIDLVRPDYWKLIGGMEEAYHLKSIHPGMKIIYRHHEDDWKRYVMAEDKDKLAEEFLGYFRDSLLKNADVIYGVEELNEYIATNDYATLEQVSGWVEAFCAALDRMGMPAVPITFNTAVGNPQVDHLCQEQGIPSQIAYLVRGVRATVWAGGEVAYHAYHGARAIGPGEYYCTLDGEERQYYSMRWTLWDEHFRALEDPVYPPYFFSERGTIYVAPWGGMPLADAGWKYELCYGGDMQWRLEQAIRRELHFERLVAKWNAEHGNRARGGATFLHGGGPDWSMFDWAGEPSRALANALVG